MIRNFQRGGWMEETSYELQFFYDNTGGCAFPCDEHGKVSDALNPLARENYKRCLESPEKFQIFNHVHKLVRRWREPDKGTCHCGNTVYLQNEYMGACQCERCGQWYNLSGQELLPPDKWDMGYDD